MKLYYSFNVLMRPLKIIINACKLKLIYVSDCQFLTTQIIFLATKKNFGTLTFKDSRTPSAIVLLLF
jgi:hypothetical protein